jgi:hypothetical protein
MKTFPAVASKFELYPADSTAAKHLAPLVGRVSKLSFELCVKDAATNQGQMDSNFDKVLEELLLSNGAAAPSAEFLSQIRTMGIRQELDFSFSFGARTVAVEVEKANREKILRDILKSHQYLSSGADFALIVLPSNYAHSGGVWDLFQFGRQLYDQCLTYDFGKREIFDRIALVGFTQYCADTNSEISAATRIRMRKAASEYFATLVKQPTS